MVFHLEDAMDLACLEFVLRRGDPELVDRLVAQIRARPGNYVMPGIDSVQCPRAFGVCSDDEVGYHIYLGRDLVEPDSTGISASRLAWQSWGGEVNFILCEDVASALLPFVELEPRYFFAGPDDSPIAVVLPGRFHNSHTNYPGFKIYPRKGGGILITRWDFTEEPISPDHRFLVMRLDSEATPF